MSGQANIDLLGAEAPSQAERRFMRGHLVAELERRERERRDLVVNVVLQVAIGILTSLAVWLVASDGPEARWGHVAGLASQPFYIVATWRARQWGMFMVAIALCGLWARGIVIHFL